MEYIAANIFFLILKFLYVILLMVVFGDVLYFNDSGLSQLWRYKLAFRLRVVRGVYFLKVYAPNLILPPVPSLVRELVIRIGWQKDRAVAVRLVLLVQLG